MGGQLKKALNHDQFQITKVSLKEVPEGTKLCFDIPEDTRPVNPKDKVGDIISVEQHDGKWREAKIVKLFKGAKDQVTEVSVQYKCSDLVTKVPVDKTAVHVKEGALKYVETKKGPNSWKTNVKGLQDVSSWCKIAKVQYLDKTKKYISDAFDLFKKKL